MGGDDWKHTNCLTMNHNLSEFKFTPPGPNSFGNRPRELDFQMDFNHETSPARRRLSIYFHKGTYYFNWERLSPEEPRECEAFPGGGQGFQWLDPDTK